MACHIHPEGRAKLDTPARWFGSLDRKWRLFTGRGRHNAEGQDSPSREPDSPQEYNAVDYESQRQGLKEESETSGLESWIRLMQQEKERLEMTASMRVEQQLHMREALRVHRDIARLNREKALILSLQEVPELSFKVEVSRRTFDLNSHLREVKLKHKMALQSSLAWRAKNGEVLSSLSRDRARLSSQLANLRCRNDSLSGWLNGHREKVARLKVEGIAQNNSLEAEGTERRRLIRKGEEIVAEVQQLSESYWADAVPYGSLLPEDVSELSSLGGRLQGRMCVAGQTPAVEVGQGRFLELEGLRQRVASADADITHLSTTLAAASAAAELARSEAMAAEFMAAEAAAAFASLPSVAASAQAAQTFLEAAGAEDEELRKAQPPLPVEGTSAVPLPSSSSEVENVFPSAMGLSMNMPLLLQPQWQQMAGLGMMFNVPLLMKSPPTTARLHGNGHEIPCCHPDAQGQGLPMMSPQWGILAAATTTSPQNTRITPSASLASCAIANPNATVVSVAEADALRAQAQNLCLHTKIDALRERHEVQRTSDQFSQPHRKELRAIAEGNRSERQDWQHNLLAKEVAEQEKLRQEILAQSVRMARKQPLHPKCRRKERALDDVRKAPSNRALARV